MQLSYNDTQKHDLKMLIQNSFIVNNQLITFNPDYKLNSQAIKALKALAPKVKKPHVELLDKRLVIMEDGFRLSLNVASMDDIQPTEIIDGLPKNLVKKLDTIAYRHHVTTPKPLQITNGVALHANGMALVEFKTRSIDSKPEFPFPWNRAVDLTSGCTLKSTLSVPTKPIKALKCTNTKSRICFFQTGNDLQIEVDGNIVDIVPQESYLITEKTYFDYNAVKAICIEAGTKSLSCDLYGPLDPTLFKLNTCTVALMPMRRPKKAN